MDRKVVRVCARCGEQEGPKRPLTTVGAFLDAAPPLDLADRAADPLWSGAYCTTRHCVCTAITFLAIDKLRDKRHHQKGVVLSPESDRRLDRRRARMVGAVVGS